MSIEEHRSGSWSPGLTPEDADALFQLATDTLEWCVEDGTGEFDFTPFTISQCLTENAATFVTLRLQGNLRGCIGTLVADAPLYMSVHHNAIQAATRDWRFSPVSTDELGQLEINISILSPISAISSPGELRMGEHGIILSKHGRRAVFLPEVASEQGWSRETTLQHLSEKAGLPPDAWREGCSFEIFQSVVLSK